MRFDYTEWQRGMYQERMVMRRGPQPEKPTPDNAKQKPLFAGLDCLENQQNLFDTDGEQPCGK